MAKRVKLFEGAEITVWKDGSWKHADGRFISEDAKWTGDVVDLAKSLVHVGDIERALVIIFRDIHRAMNPHKY